MYLIILPQFQERGNSEFSGRISYLSDIRDGRLAWTVRKALTDLFGRNLVFRVWETEFAAFLPNTTREVFLGRCGRLRSALQRRCPSQARMGRAWGEGVFTGARLLEEARAAMRQPAASVATEIREFTEGVALALKRVDLGEARFTVYLQPQIDMAIGALTGAEALVRGVGEDGSIVPPSQFIPLLEEDGAIRQLDLLVLERTLAQMSRWKQAGYGIVPVSVNLSRGTISHPSTLASILALQSRYPEVPADALELEITEGGEAVDNKDLQDLVTKYHQCGLRLSLGDFGSKYANLPLFTSEKFDTVKLDRSLISQVDSNPISRELVRGIVGICKDFHMTCVAEGVETREQVAALLDKGCAYAQEFYYDKPIPMEEFERKYLRQEGELPPGEQQEERP